MNDLQVLSQEKSYYEFFKHAKDVLPSKRDKKWEDLLVDMAISFLNSKHFKGEISQTNIDTLKKISLWSKLANNEFFIEKYDRKILQYFKSCKDIPHKCLSRINAFAKVYPFSKNLGIKLSELLYQRDQSLDLFHLVKPMAGDSLGEFYCGKKPFFTIIMKKLYIQDDQIIHKDCLKSIKPKIISHLNIEKSPKIKAKIHSLAHKYDLITPAQQDQYLVSQLLSGFTLTSELTIEAFRSLKKLSLNFNSRQAVLNHLKRQVPLPGKVFSINTKAAKAISKGFSRYFPDYLDYYSTTCLEHMKGVRTTPGGNPATYCHDFFALSKSLKLVPASKTNSYQKLLKDFQ